jgi:hypothetical protein
MTSSSAAAASGSSDGVLAWLQLVKSEQQAPLDSLPADAEEVMAQLLLLHEDGISIPKILQSFAVATSRSDKLAGGERNHANQDLRRRLATLRSSVTDLGTLPPMHKAEFSSRFPHTVCERVVQAPDPMVVVRGVFSLLQVEVLRQRDKLGWVAEVQLSSDAIQLQTTVAGRVLLIGPSQDSPPSILGATTSSSGALHHVKGLVISLHESTRRTPRVSREQLELLSRCEALVRSVLEALCPGARPQRSPSGSLQLDERGWASASDLFTRHREVEATGLDRDDPASAAADQETLAHLIQTRPTDERDPNMLKHVMAAVAASTGKRVRLSTLAGQGQSASSISAFSSLLNNDVADARMAAALVLKEPPAGEFQDVPVETIVGDRHVRKRFEVHMQREIAATLGVSPENVTILDVRQGSIAVDFLVISSTAAMNALKAYELLKEKYAANFKDMRVDPALAQLQFEAWELDSRGDKTFSGTGSTFEIGPPGNKKTYKQPDGDWTRYGLQVLERYGADQTWLHPFGHDGNWYRAYHGTGPARSKCIDTKAGHDSKTTQDSIPKSIYKKGLLIGNNQGCEAQAGAKGVYCSPTLRTAMGYTSDFTMVFAGGDTRTFRLVFQCAVKPDGVRICCGGDIWVVPDPAHIRPYGILLKMN